MTKFDGAKKRDDIQRDNNNPFRDGGSVGYNRIMCRCSNNPIWTNFVSLTAHTFLVYFIPTKYREIKSVRHLIASNFQQMKRNSLTFHINWFYLPFNCWIDFPNKSLCIYVHIYSENYFARIPHSTIIIPKYF